MKLALKIMMMLCIITVANSAIAEKEKVVKKEIVERTTTEKTLSDNSATSPVTAPKTSTHKKKKRKVGVAPKKVDTPAPVTTTTIEKKVDVSITFSTTSPTAKADTISPTAKSNVIEMDLAKAKPATQTAKSSVAKYELIWDGKGNTNAPLKDWFQISGGLRAFNDVSKNNQQPGWQTQSSDETGIDKELAFLVKVSRVGLEYRPEDHSTTIEYLFYASSLNHITVTESNVIIPKFWVVNYNPNADKDDWSESKHLSLSLGLGAEYTTIDGNISMGGYKFPTTGEGWSPVMQVEGDYHFDRVWSAGLAWEKTNVQIVTTIPGALDLKTSLNDHFTMKLTANLAELFTVRIIKLKK